LKAGRHVYSEKPLAVSREEAEAIVAEAAQKQRRVGCAPDTFFGAGIQTCRKIIDEGYLGQPLGASVHLCVPGQEFWHPEPEFYYQAGGGPLLDMAPYYLTALVYLLGPIRSVTAKAKASYEEREIRRGPRKGKKIQVEVPTFVAGAVEFESGPIASLLASYDVWATEHPHIEIYGTEGTLLVPDPDRFEGPVRISRKRRGWMQMPLHSDYSSNHRGIGVADMAHALLSGRPHRASAELAYHVLEAALSLAGSAERGSHISIESRCERPAPLPSDLPYGILDG
jgi:predicted dehydrogenase